MLDKGKLHKEIPSHSTRVRGLKCPPEHRYPFWECVALYTSAWIEIISIISSPRSTMSRTLHECVDWNIFHSASSQHSGASHSTRVRGLKSSIRHNWRVSSRSHSTRVRGLKYPTAYYRSNSRLSHSTRVRGLKCWLLYTWESLTGCRTLHECVDWNPLYRMHPDRSFRRTLHECVDWNYLARADWNQYKASHSTRVRGLK